MYKSFILTLVAILTQRVLYVLVGKMTTYRDDDRRSGISAIEDMPYREEEMYKEKISPHSKGEQRAISARHFSAYKLQIARAIKNNLTKMCHRTLR